jgi:ubiquinone biosynthesis O-methyltransferase
MDPEKSTVSSAEVDKFRALSANWWDQAGEFKPLHSMNVLRVALVKDGLKVDNLRGLEILDVGCGGGILSEALARCGASGAVFSSVEPCVCWQVR